MDFQAMEKQEQFCNFLGKISKNKIISASSEIAEFLDLWIQLGFVKLGSEESQYEQVEPFWQVIKHYHDKFSIIPIILSIVTVNQTLQQFLNKILNYRRKPVEWNKWPLPVKKLFELGHLVLEERNKLFPSPVTRFSSYILDVLPEVYRIGTKTDILKVACFRASERTICTSLFLLNPLFNFYPTLDTMWKSLYQDAWLIMVMNPKGPQLIHESGLISFPKEFFLKHISKLRNQSPHSIINNLKGQPESVVFFDENEVLKIPDYYINIPGPFFNKVEPRFDLRVLSNAPILPKY